MKEFRDKNNMIYIFDDDCFDENDQAINEYALKVIEENNLISITHEEAEVIRNYKSQEQIAEEDRLSKLPTQEEIEDAKLTVKILEMKELGLI